MQMRGWGWLMVLLVAGTLAWAAPAVPQATMEKVRTDEGTRLVWHRAPAEATDLEMPFLAQALLLDSAVYRVRDRKRHDLLRYAVAHFTIAQTADSIVQTYREALGPEAQLATDAQTGVVTISAGTADNSRLVTVTPKTGDGAAPHAIFSLERTQRFAITPRVLSAVELRVVEVMERLGVRYRAMSRVKMTIRQQASFPAAPLQPLPPPLIWTMDFTRPGQLQVAAHIDKEEAMTVTTRDGALIVSQQGQDERRPIPEGITAEVLPELYGDPDEDPVGDPVVRLLLGGELISPDTDYYQLTLKPGQPGELVLTYPENALTLRLLFNPASKVITRSIVDVVQDGHPLRITRDYETTVSDAPPPAATPAPVAAPPGP